MVSGQGEREREGIVALLRAGDVRTLLARHSDLALAGLVVAIVGMMIVPLPTPLLDFLISVNIATGVVLLLVAIYDELPSFPCQPVSRSGAAASRSC